MVENGYKRVYLSKFYVSESDFKWFRNSKLTDMFLDKKFEIPTIVSDVSLLTKCHKPPDFEVEKPLQGSVSAANNNGKILGTVKKEGYGKR